MWIKHKENWLWIGRHLSICWDTEPPIWRVGKDTAGVYVWLGRLYITWYWG